MYFISENSSFNESENTDIFGTLIGIHGNYLYSANSIENELKIYRKKVSETQNWKLIWSFVISSTSFCMCANTVSAAYGIIENELFVAAFGMKTNEFESRFHLSSINLITDEIIDYKTDHINVNDFAYNLCNQCCLSSITSLNSENSSEICIIPWSPEPFPRISSTIGNHVDCIQIKLTIDLKTKICNYVGAAGFSICKHSENEQNLNQSNIGIMEFGKIVYFRENNLILAGRNASETNLEIFEDSDLQSCLYAGFYRTPFGLKCIAFQNGEYRNQQICGIFNLSINEEKNLAKFTKVSQLPSVLLPSDPRYSKFVMDSRMLICSNQTQTFTYIFGMLSLTEMAYISASNSSSPLFRELQKYSKIKKPKFGDRRGIHKKSQKFGLSQNGIKRILGLQKSFKFCIC